MINKKRGSYNSAPSIVISKTGTKWVVIMGIYYIVHSVGKALHTTNYLKLGEVELHPTYPRKKSAFVNISYLGHMFQ